MQLPARLTADLENTFGCRNEEQMLRQPRAGVAGVEGEGVPEATADWTLQEQERGQLLKGRREVSSRC